MSALTIRALRKAFGSHELFDGFSLDMSSGECVALVGASGSGKTTLLRCIASLAQADEGEIRVGAHDMMRLDGAALRRARHEIGFIFQQFNLVERRSALHNVLTGSLAATPLWRVVGGCFDRDHVNEARACLERVGLGAFLDVRADRLSGGQQQRVAIARALMQHSTVLLADEPVSSLDPDTAREILALLKDLARERNIAVLCSLHQPDLARTFADRVVRMG